MYGILAKGGFHGTHGTPSSSATALVARNPCITSIQTLVNMITAYIYSRDKLLIQSHHFPANSHLPFDNTLISVIDFPKIFNRLGQLLVNMTALEFLCAQAPRFLQGLLIGLWYAMFSIRYLVMKSLDYVITSPEGVLIYPVVRTGLVLLSLVMHVCVSRGYQYTIRDWVVNVQRLVEDVFERRIRQEESYMRQ